MRKRHLALVPYSRGLYISLVKWIEGKYRSEMERLGGTGRIERALNLFQETYSSISHQILQENPSLPPSELRRQVALRLYATEPAVVQALQSIETRG